MSEVAGQKTGWWDDQQHSCPMTDKNLRSRRLVRAYGPRRQTSSLEPKTWTTWDGQRDAVAGTVKGSDHLVSLL